MSGVFMIVEDCEHKPNVSPLRATKGGYPHVTLVYSGKAFKAPVLLEVGTAVLQEWVQQNNGNLPVLYLTQRNAYVNDPFPESKEGQPVRECYDVLLGLEPADVATIKAFREKHIPATEHRLHKRPPHVTHSVHYTKKDAEEALRQLRAHFPIKVQVTGFTID